MTIQEVRKWEVSHNVYLPAIKKYMRKENIRGRTEPGYFNWDKIEVQMDPVYLQAKEALNNILKKYPIS